MTENQLKRYEIFMLNKSFHINSFAKMGMKDLIPYDQKLVVILKNVFNDISKLVYSESRYN